MRAVDKCNRGLLKSIVPAFYYGNGGRNSVSGCDIISIRLEMSHVTTVPITTKREEPKLMINDSRSYHSFWCDFNFFPVKDGAVHSFSCLSLQLPSVFTHKGRRVVENINKLRSGF